MLLLELFFEFFKIGLFAVGGGPATLPYLIDLAEKKPWYTIEQLTNMIAISESTPGPIGVNMATYAGFHCEGILGAITATFGLVLPSFIIMIFIAKLMNKYSCNMRLKYFLDGVRPAVLALILCAALPIAKLTLINEINVFLFLALLAGMRIWKKSPIFYIGLMAVIGIIFKL